MDRTDRGDDLSRHHSGCNGARQSRRPERAAHWRDVWHRDRLSIFIATTSTYTALAQLAPAVAQFPSGGLTPAALAETNRIEAGDGYLLELASGVLLSVLSLGTVTATLTLGPLWKKYDRPREVEPDPAHYAIATQEAAAKGEFESLD